MANEMLRESTLKIEIDCGDAIKGLKALQREAKEATKALRELEEAKGRVVNA